MGPTAIQASSVSVSFVLSTNASNPSLVLPDVPTPFTVVPGTDVIAVTVTKAFSLNGLGNVTRFDVATFGFGVIVTLPA